MKAQLWMLLTLLVWNASASSATDLKEVVLGEDFQTEPDNMPYMFPCSTYMDVLFCDNRVMLEDRVCARSLQFVKHANDQVVINCRLSSGETITVARTLLGRSGGPVRDDTIASAYYHLQFNPRVTLIPANSRQTLIRIK
jgi:hypothetical protein